MRINVNIEGIDALTSRLNKLCNIENALLKGGEVVRAEAQANCPKDTGRLANSIVVQSEGGNSVLIGPTAEYGIYVEFGTGSKGDSSKPHTSKKGWVYFNERTGGFVYTTGQAPQPFLIPALYSQRDAVIIPVTKEKLEDTTINVFSELKSQIAEAFYTAIDSACLFGTNSPFATNVYKAISDNEMIVTDNKNIDIAVSDAMALVEENGYDPNGYIGRIGVKNQLRKLRDTNGAPAYVNGTSGSELYAQPIEFVRNGAWDNTKCDLITGAWKYAIVGIRDGIGYEILREATLQGTLDEDGKPLSLAEQDMVAIKATMRLGFLVVKDDAFAAFKNAVPTLGTLTVTSVEGSATGKSKITAEPKAVGGHRLVYKAAASAQSVTYDADLSAWTEFNSGDELTLTNGQKITVAEVTADGKARKSGNATIVSKA